MSDVSVGCSKHGELPPAPPGRHGWPWTEGYRFAPTDEAADARLPRFSIVTPSYNQGEYIEETIRSVLLQGYPELEYIVIDGGSSDATVEILRKYEPWLAHWSSEPDRGQSDAINKGFRRATGEIFAWLNSDDIYNPGTLGKVARAMERRSCDLYLGAMDKVAFEDGRMRHVKRSTPHAGLPLHPVPIFAGAGRCDFHFIQPPLFWRRWVWDCTHGLDERYHYVMDLEWCTRALAAGARVETSDEVLARFTVHQSAKTQARLDRAMWERAHMYLRLCAKAEYRTFPCLISALLPMQRALSIKAGRARARGAGGRALAFRAGAAAAKRAWRAARWGWPHSTSVNGAAGAARHDRSMGPGGRRPEADGI